MPADQPTDWGGTTHRSASLSFDHRGRSFVVLWTRPPGGRLEATRAFPIGGAGDYLAVIFERAALIASWRWWGYRPLPGDPYVDEAVGTPLTGDLAAWRTSRPSDA